MIDGHERVADVARDLDLHKSLLQTWVRDERWRIAEAGAGAPSDPSGRQLLSADERAELVRLRARVAEQAETIAFLEKAWAYISALLNRPELPEKRGTMPVNAKNIRAKALRLLGDRVDDDDFE